MVAGGMFGGMSMDCGVMAIADCDALVPNGVRMRPFGEKDPGELAPPVAVSMLDKLCPCSDDSDFRLSVSLSSLRACWCSYMNIHIHISCYMRLFSALLNNNGL